MSTSSGSRVRLLGTIATSSRRYPLRADLPIPISTSAMTAPPRPRHPAAGKGRVYRGGARGPETGSGLAGQLVVEREAGAVVVVGVGHGAPEALQPAGPR